MERIVRRKGSRFYLLPASLALISTAFVLIPLINMFTQMDLRSIRQVFGQGDLALIIGRSVGASVLTTIASLVLAYGMAWCMERTAMGGKKVFRLLIVLPMLIPSVSIGMGTVLLWGNNGLITNLMGLPLSGIYGLKGIVLGSVLYSLPVAFLMIDNILKFEDSSPYEAATILGLSRWNQFTAITFPYLRKPMIVVAFSIFTLSFTDYGVPLMVGGKFKTLPMVMYQEVIGQLNFGKGCVYGSMLLIPAVIAFVLDFMNQNQANSAYVTRPFLLHRQPLRDALATLYSLVLSLFSVLPIVSFVVLAFVRKYPDNMSLTFRNIVNALNMGAGRYLVNSVVIALSVSVIGVTIAVLTAYYTARYPSAWGRYLHLVCMSMAAVPGVVLGLSYVLLFRSSFLYGTLALLIIVNTVHFFASPYMMMYTSFSKANQNLEAVASTLGIGKRRLLTDILLPKCKHTVLEMAASFFVNCMMTISAVSFLANSRTKPVALMINQFEAQAQMEYAAVVSLLILLINLAVKILLEWQPSKRSK